MSVRRIIRIRPLQNELFGVLHADGTPARGVVMCAPFGEEAKSSYRVFFDFAEQMAAKGWAALRFDYYGTGNSSGGFDEFAPSAARDDIRAAIASLRDAGAHKVGLLGLGLGGTLAFELAAKGECDFLVLWQPIVNGEEFYKLNVKQQLVRQMLIRAKAQKSEAHGPARTGGGDIIDLDGYPLRKTAADEIRQMNLLKLGSASLPPTLLMQISFSQNVAPDIQALLGTCHPAPQTQCVVCEPFWKRIGSVDCTPVHDGTLRWLDTLANRD